MSREVSRILDTPRGSMTYLFPAVQVRVIYRLRKLTRYLQESALTECRQPRSGGCRHSCQGTGYLPFTISSLSAREIMIGKTGDKFDLHNSVTLDQIANVAGRITGAVDVKDFSAGVAWGKDGGLKTGNVSATRGDVLKALYVAAGSPAVEDTSILAKFKDASGIPADMAAIAAWAAQNGILKGDLSGNTNLTTNVTRGQACALAGRTMGTLA